MANDVAKQIEDFEKQLEELVEQRAEINRRIQHLKQVIESLSALHSVPADPALAALAEQEAQGLTSSISQILRVEPRTWKTISDVRKRLVFYGVSLAKYANSSAAIRTVLERLVTRGDAERDPDSKVARYRKNMRPVEEEIKKGLAKSRKKD